MDLLYRILAFLFLFLRFYERHHTGSEHGCVFHGCGFVYNTCDPFDTNHTVGQSIRAWAVSFSPNPPPVRIRAQRSNGQSPPTLPDRHRRSRRSHLQSPHFSYLLPITL